MWGSRQFCIYTLYTYTKNVWKSKIFKTFSAVWWNNIHQHCCLFLMTSADISGSLTVTLSALVPFNSEVHFNTSAGLVESDQRWWAQWFVSGWTAPPGDRKAEMWRHTKLLFTSRYQAETILFIHLMWGVLSVHPGLSYLEQKCALILK